MPEEIITVEQPEGTEQEKLDDLYLRLGKAYYQERNNDPLPSLINLFDQISDILNHPKKENICPNCGKEVTEEAIFCSQCGHKLIEE